MYSLLFTSCATTYAHALSSVFQPSPSQCLFSSQMGIRGEIPFLLQEFPALLRLRHLHFQALKALHLDLEAPT